jgi:hypothetical protein
MSQFYRRQVKFLDSYRRRSRYHRTTCQVNIAKHAAHWLTQVHGILKVQISNTKLKINHSESHWVIVWLHNLSRHNHWFPEICNLFQAQFNAISCVLEDKINPNILLIYELLVTVKLCRAACNLSDADWNFFQNLKISVPGFCLISLPVHNNISVRILVYQRKP